MSSDTLSTTLRVLNHFCRPCATKPSMTSVVARSSSGFGGGRAVLLLVLRLLVLGLVVLGLVVLGIEDGLHPLLRAALHQRPILGQVDRDALAAHHVVVLPHARVASEHHALVEVGVLCAPRGTRAAV